MYIIYVRILENRWYGLVNERAICILAFVIPDGRIHIMADTGSVDNKITMSCDDSYLKQKRKI